MSSQGYLPQQIIAYATAWLSVKKGEKTDYDIFFKDQIKNTSNKV